MPHHIFQLLMVVHFKHHCNTYGSLSAYIVGLVVRFSGGEALIGLPAFIRFPGYDEENERQLFPFRTMAMLLSLITLWGVSAYSKWVFETGKRAFYTNTHVLQIFALSTNDKCSQINAFDSVFQLDFIIV